MAKREMIVCVKIHRGRYQSNPNAWVSVIQSASLHRARTTALYWITFVWIRGWSEARHLCRCSIWLSFKYCSPVCRSPEAPQRKHSIRLWLDSQWSSLDGMLRADEKTIVPCANNKCAFKCAGYVHCCLLCYRTISHDYRRRRKPSTGQRIEKKNAFSDERRKKARSEIDFNAHKQFHFSFNAILLLQFLTLALAAKCVRYRSFVGGKKCHLKFSKATHSLG